MWHSIWHSSMLALHIMSGIVGLLSGTVALAFRKGGRGHRLSGDVFALSMMSLGASAAVLAIAKHDTGNLVGGVFTVYLMASAWITVQGNGNQWPRASWAAVMVPLAVSVLDTIGGVQALHRPPIKGGAPIFAYFMLSALALLTAFGDIRVLLHRGIAGRQRLVRHLWRMCFGLFVASGSIFIARPRLFPVFMRTTHLLLLLGFLPLIIVVFWLARVRFPGVFLAQHSEATRLDQKTPEQALQQQVNENGAHATGAAA